MAPKKGGGPVERVEAKQILTAVLLADSFTQRFRPITVEKPKVLLPLVNVPLLEYTLEWLAMNKVEEIIVFCCAHADQIKAHLSEGKWLKQRAPRVTTVVSTNCLSLGEAMRSLDQKDIIKSTFILVSGDTVSNMDLGPALAAHKERAEKDKDAIMTLVRHAQRAQRAQQAPRGRPAARCPARRAPLAAAAGVRRRAQVMKPTESAHQRLRLGDTNLLVALDPASQRLLKYQELDGPAPPPPGGAAHGHGHGHGHGHHHHHRRGRGGRCWKLDAALWSERDSVQVRTDLLDTAIAICSPEVLLMFSDNFDYQTLKRDFVCGTLSEEELGKKVYLYILQGEYAARIHSLRSYDAVSRDLLARWGYPFTPDTNVFHKAGPWGPSSYRYARGHKYLESATTCSRGAQLGPCLAIGAGTTIADGCVLSRCVIGRGCTVGRDCVLTGCYLQDGVKLGDGVTAAHALLCEGVVVGSGAVISPGVVLSYGCVVGPRHTVPPHSVISLCKQLNSQVSLSDDELEYTSAGRVSSSGGRPQARRGRQSSSGGGARKGRRPGSDSSSSGSSSGSSSSDSEESSSSSAFGDLGDAPSLEKPSELAVEAARAAQSAVLGTADKAGRGGGAAKGGATSDIGFATHLVGEGGAGYAWPMAADGYCLAASSIAPPPMSVLDYSYGSDDEGGDGGGGGSDEPGGERGAARGDGGDAGGGAGAGGRAAPLDPETMFMQEVGETFLRCVKERFAETNAVIELNGLKIAEDRTFADCARYIFTAMLQLCLPCPPWVSPEYASLFPSDAPDSGTKDGKLALLGRFKRQLGEWGNLLRRFLRSEDDQVELLLTLEEFCSEEGVFEAPEGGGAPSGAAAAPSGGAAFAPLFANLLQLLYDGEVVEEAAVTSWAAEKEHADEADKVYLLKSAAFLEWLKTADEEEDDSEAESE
ncbi:translation initiation factor eIF-2B subunit epsilon [Scenedesmus sp. PABB004]|nr:translation initiation factor eIF-2B subunit epsilon [Scenedesmus sp. PABB004]